MPKPLVAHQKMREFDPECELHLPLLYVKVVDPGCTRELQIENCVTGQVVRLTTTDSESHDKEAFEKALLAAFRQVWHTL